MDTRHDGQWMTLDVVYTVITRPFLVAAGVAAMLWAAAALPVLWSERNIVDVARAILAGEGFKPEVLVAVSAQAENKNGRVPRSAVLGKVAVIRLRQVEDRVRIGNMEGISNSLDATNAVVDEALVNSPSDPFLWLARFWLANARYGWRSDHLKYLKMSYDLGPNEGWIAIKRSRITLPAFARLPKDFAERAVAEFVSLVRWKLSVEAADIAGGPARAIQNVLFPRLKDLNDDQRRPFAKEVYRRELDDVPVPGVEPPRPNVRVPLLPPGY